MVEKIGPAEVEKSLATAPGSYSLKKITALVSPAAQEYIEQMAQVAARLTIRRFGKTIQLYAPVYVSNFCINSCIYCGYNCQNKFERTRLSIAETVAEAEVIASEGFRHILIVSGEDREFITVDYLAELAGRLRSKFSSLSVEIYPMEVAEYEKLFRAGIDGVTLYQETYDRDTYAKFHPAGPKADYDRRVGSLERAGQAGMRRLGLGVLLGLGDWRAEALALAEHASFLMKRYWRSQVSFSFPRLRPARDVNVDCERLLSDKNLVQMMLALRLCFADAGIVISTRESAQLRDELVKLGVTRMSAGSKTNPGGYSGQAETGRQFEIDDGRSANQVAAMIRTSGLEAVWKDWDSAFTSG